MNQQRETLNKKSPKSELLVLHAGSLGDCALAIHLINALQRLWKTGATLVARSSIAKWAERRGLIARTMSIDCSEVRGLVNNNLEISQETQHFVEGFGRLVSFLGDRSQVFARRANDLMDNRAYHVDPRAQTTPPRDQLHIISQWANQLTDQGITVPMDALAALTDGDSFRCAHRADLARKLNDPGPFIVIHPGSGGVQKCLPLELLEDVARKLKRQRHVTLIWIIGPDEFERFGPEYVSRLEKVAPVIFEESIERAADIVAGADLYIGYDAGMTHVAALAGVPTIAIFGPTNPRVWGPLGRHCHIHLFPSTSDLTNWADELVQLSIRVLHTHDSPPT